MRQAVTRAESEPCRCCRRSSKRHHFLVLAAGGIGTGRGLAAVLAAGGEGVMIGTALLASPETVGPDYARDRVVEAGSADTIYTSVFDRARSQPWPQRWGGRAVANEFTAAWHGVDADEEMLAKAYDPSDPHSGVVYAGEAVGLVHGTHPAGDVVRRIGADAERSALSFRLKARSDTAGSHMRR